MARRVRCPKFKYDDHKPVEHREHVSDQLKQRGHGTDSTTAPPATAAPPQRDRDWRAPKARSQT
jgi:hypothetical protein